MPARVAGPWTTLAIPGQHWEPGANPPKSRGSRVSAAKSERHGGATAEEMVHTTLAPAPACAHRAPAHLRQAPTWPRLPPKSCQPHSHQHKDTLLFLSSTCSEASVASNRSTEKSLEPAPPYEDPTTSSPREQPSQGSLPPKTSSQPHTQSCQQDHCLGAQVSEGSGPAGAVSGWMQGWTYRKSRWRLENEGQSHIPPAEPGWRTRCPRSASHWYPVQRGQPYSSHLPPPPQLPRSDGCLEGQGRCRGIHQLLQRGRSPADSSPQALGSVPLKPTRP